MSGGCDVPVVAGLIHIASGAWEGGSKALRKGVIIWLPNVCIYVFYRFAVAYT